MIVHRGIEQGSPEWRKLRLGIPTASNFSRIFTPKGKLSKSETQQRYMNELLAEWILGFPIDEFTTKWVDRGTELEPKARQVYEFRYDVEVEQVAFVTTDDGMIGASPDGLVRWPNGVKSGLEIKCPKHSTHVGYMLGAVDDEYKPQVQGGLFVCDDRELWDVCSYCPEMPLVVARAERDKAFIAGLRDGLTEFVEIMLAKREELTSRYGDFLSQVVTQADEEPGSSFDVSDEDVDIIWAAREMAQKG